MDTNDLVCLWRIRISTMALSRKWTSTFMNIKINTILRLFYLLFVFALVADCDQKRNTDLSQLHEPSYIYMCSKESSDNGEQICANTLLKPVASYEIKNDLSKFLYLTHRVLIPIPPQADTCQDFVSCGSIKELKIAQRNFFPTLTTYFPEKRFFNFVPYFI